MSSVVLEAGGERQVGRGSGGGGGCGFLGGPVEGGEKERTRGGRGTEEGREKREGGRKGGLKRRKRVSWGGQVKLDKTREQGEGGGGDGGKRRKWWWMALSSDEGVRKERERTEEVVVPWCFGARCWLEVLVGAGGAGGSVW